MRYLLTPKRLELFGARRLFVCLDFDGTLVAIRRLPDRVFLSSRKRNVLKRLAGNPLQAGGIDVAPLKK